MGLLGRTLVLASLAASTSCYEPALRDCTLACTTGDDCAAGQICGSDRFCAAPELAGHCFTRPVRDGGAIVDGDDHDDDGMTGVDSGVPVDAAPPIDAPPDEPATGTITVMISGKGYVAVGQHGTCDSDPPQSGHCVFVVPLSTPVTAFAFADDDWRFEEWTSSTCPDEDERSCTFQPATATILSVRFRKGDDD